MVQAQNGCVAGVSTRMRNVWTCFMRHCSAVIDASMRFQRMFDTHWRAQDPVTVDKRTNA